jgi:hypothetical protein
MSSGGDVLAWEIVEHYLIRSPSFSLSAGISIITSQMHSDSNTRALVLLLSEGESPVRNVYFDNRRSTFTFGSCFRRLTSSEARQCTMFCCCRIVI